MASTLGTVFWNLVSLVVAATKAPNSFLISSTMQDVAVNYRLSYFLRRYQACDCDARHLRTAAGWMEALLRISLPAASRHVSCTPGSAAGIAVSQTGSAAAVQQLQEVELTQVTG